MKRLIPLLLLTAAAASAQTSNFGACNSARVSAGDCSDTAHVFFLFSGDPTPMLAFRDTLSASGGWQATIPCEESRRVEEGVLKALGESIDGCTLGVDLANPQSENQAAMNHLAFNLRRWHRRATTTPEVVPPEPEIGSTEVP